MTDTDRELLKLAAKAASFTSPHTGEDGEFYVWRELTRLDGPTGLEELVPWNPLTDDGDALGLAVKLVHIDVSRCILAAWQESDTEEGRREYVRRAIVRAAAEIGRTTP